MRPIFQPRLVNGPFGDPGLYVDILFERRALLFDLGDIAALPPRKLLRTSHVFVSHTHMDHFVGFDRLLRVCLGRERPLHFYGPAGFIGQVGHKLAAFTWNLVENYAIDLVIHAHEVTADGDLRHAEFVSRERFVPRDRGVTPLRDGVLLDEPAFTIRCVVLDHKTPCLAFAIQETMHINVWRNRLEELGLAPGPWLRDIKRQVFEGVDDETPVRVGWRERAFAGAEEPVRATTVTLGQLKRDVLRLVPGEKIVYVTDVAHHADNARRIVQFARDADLLFIEATFLDQDRDDAARKYHLTARQAGSLAREARVHGVVPFHFSPRYSDRESALREEVNRALFGAGGRFRRLRSTRISRHE